MSRTPNRRDLIHVAGDPRVYNRINVLIVLLIPLAMSLMAVSSTSVALPSMQSELAASDADIQWVLAGYSLVYGVSMVPFGRMGDLLGRGRLFVIGVALFTLASLWCGLSSNPGSLIAARVLQGIGSGMLSPQITGMITQYFSGQGRAKAFSLFGVVVSASVAVGPLLTGFIIALLGPSIGWRTSFIVNVVFGVVAIVLAARWFPFDMEKRRKQAKEAGVDVESSLDLDPVGALLLAVAVLLVMLPFILQVPALYGLVALGALALVGWVWWERHYAARGRSPMVDLSLFRHRSYSFSTAISSIQMMAGPSVFVIIALYVQRDLGATALVSALVGLPNAVASAIGASASGKHALTIGRNLVVTALLLMIGGVLLAAGLVAWLDRAVPLWALAGALVVMGFGQGVMGSVNQTLALAEIPATEGGVAGGVKQTGERVATAMSQAIFPAIFFAAANHDWSRGLVNAYLAIAGTALVSAILAIVDRVQGGPGVPAELRR